MITPIGENRLACMVDAWPVRLAPVKMSIAQFEHRDVGRRLPGGAVLVALFQVLAKRAACLAIGHFADASEVVKITGYSSREYVWAVRTRLEWSLKDYAGILPAT